jgi:hypothetical protein
MNKFIVSGLMIAALTAVSSVALAEGSQTKLPADVAACVNACLSNSPCTTRVETCDGQNTRVSALEAELADLKKKLFPKRTNVKPQVDRVKQLQEQLAALTARVDKNEAEIARVAQLLRDETAKLDGLTADVAALTQRVNEIEGRLKEIDRLLAEHGKKLDNHEERLEKLELAPPAIKVGFHAGFLGLHAFGSGTDYTAVPVTASLTFPISKRVTVFTEAGIALSGDRYAVGTVLHGAAQYHFDQHWSIDGGVSTVWAGFNSHLKVAQASFLGDVGPTYTNGVFMARGSVMAGPAFEPTPKGASFALGGMLTIGVVLP